MWVVVCGMKRSGSTLQYQIAKRVLRVTGAGTAVEWVPEEEFSAVLEGAKNTLQYCLYKCHLCTNEITALFSRGEAVGLYTMRDPWGALASWQRKTKVSFEQLWTSGLVEETRDHQKRFLSQPRMLVSRYEEFVGDIPGEVRRVANHLGLGLDDASIAEIAADLTLEKQKARMKEIEEGRRRHFRLGPQVIDAEELLHADHITGDGESGGGEHFSPIERHLLMRRIGGWVKELGYSTSLPSLSVLDRLRLHRRYRLLESRRKESREVRDSSRGPLK